jgi:hypothetical protein
MLTAPANCVTFRDYEPIEWQWSTAGESGFTCVEPRSSTCLGEVCRHVEHLCETGGFKVSAITAELTPTESWGNGCQNCFQGVHIVGNAKLVGDSEQKCIGRVPVELVSSTIAWAIYGAAKEWAMSPKRMSVDRIGGTIEKVVAPILTAVAQEHTAQPRPYNQQT